MNKKTSPPPAKAGSSKERFERFVSALVRVPKKEVDDKQKEIDAIRKTKKGLQGGV